MIKKSICRLFLAVLLAKAMLLTIIAPAMVLAQSPTPDTIRVYFYSSSGSSTYQDKDRNYYYKYDGRNYGNWDYLPRPSTWTEWTATRVLDSYNQPIEWANSLKNASFGDTYAVRWFKGQYTMKCWKSAGNQTVWHYNIEVKPEYLNTATQLGFQWTLPLARNTYGIGGISSYGSGIAYSDYRNMSW